MIHHLTTLFSQRILVLQVLVLLCALGLTHKVHATVEYALQGGSSLYYFDNPFLFGTNDDRRKSSSAWSTDLGASLFIPLPTERSHLLLSGAASKIRFGSLNQLEHTKTQWDALYEWEFSTFLRGKLFHRDDKRLYNYYEGLSDGRRPQLSPQPPSPGNIENLELPHIKDTQAEVALRISPRFDIPYTYTRQSLRFIDDYNITPYSRDNRAHQLAFRYESGSKSTLSAGVKNTTVNFPLRTPEERTAYDSGYRDREIFLDTAWRYTENTIVLGHLGTVQRKFDTLHDRRLKALELGADWHYSVKTWFTLRLWDRPESIDDSGNKLFLQVRGAQVRMMWESTPKTRFAFLTSVEQERYETFTTANNPGDFTSVNQQNKILRLGVRFDYDITPRLNLRLEANRRQELSSSDNKHNNGVVRASIRYSFENLTGHNRARLKLDSMQ